MAMIGSGVRRSKLVLPGRMLAALPGAEVAEGLATADRLTGQPATPAARRRSATVRETAAGP
jgi:hypothetical protein